MLRHCLNFSKTQSFLGPRHSVRHLFFAKKTESHIRDIRKDDYTDVSECDGIRVITLNNPQTCNALSMGMMESILNGITENCNDKCLRCMVLTANGKVWSAGHDLKELATLSRSKQMGVFDKLTEIILNIRASPVPVIAEVNGLAAAAGCQLASSCDMLVASDNSQFSTPGARFGIFCSTPGVALSRAMISRSKAAYMLMTSLPITAKEAYEAGLVTRLVPESKLDEEVADIIAAIKNQSREVIAFGKDFFYRQLSIGDLKEAYNTASKAMVDNLHLPDGKEGIRSFIEKRPPVWKHE